jgi:actin-related protein
MKQEIAGSNLTQYLTELIRKKDPSSEPLDDKTANTIKEQYCFVSLDFEEDMKTNASKNAEKK